MQHHRETERALPGDARSQGDIIRIEYPQTSDAPTLGVIINADCDLEHHRLDGVITYLPIFPFPEYLSRFWAAGHIAEVKDAATQAILKVLGDVEAEGPGLHTWIRSSGHEAVFAALSALDGVKKRELTQIAREVARLDIALDYDKPPYERFSALCHADADPEAHARKHLNAAKKAMGEGHFFISELVDDNTIGFVVRMRRIYEIPEQDCFRSVSDQKARSGGTGTTAVRIGRLTPLYRFKVLQLFVHQFSRVGLPDDVTALSNLAIDDLVASIA